MTSYMFFNATVAIFQAAFPRDEEPSPLAVLTVPVLLFWPFDPEQETAAIQKWVEDKHPGWDPDAMDWRLADRDQDVEQEPDHFICHGRPHGADDDTVVHITAWEDQDPDDIFVRYVLLEQHDPTLVDPNTGELDGEEDGFYLFSTTRIPGAPFRSDDEWLSWYRGQRDLVEAKKLLMDYFQADAAHRAYLFHKPVETFTNKDHDQVEILAGNLKRALINAKVYVKTQEKIQEACPTPT